MNIALTLTSNEKKIIKQITSQVVRSLTRIGENGHPEFELLKEEYEVDELDCKVGITDHLIMYEGIEEVPEDIGKLQQMDLLVAKYVILDILPKDKLPKAKRNLLRKIDNILKFKTLNEN